MQAAGGGRRAEIVREGTAPPYQNGDQGLLVKGDRDMMLWVGKKLTDAFTGTRGLTGGVERATGGTRQLN